MNAFPQDQWPDNIPLLYYSYHIMVGLGTIFIAIMVVCGLAAVARQAVQRALDALDSDAGSAVPLHRQHRGLDDRGTRPPALAGLWPDAHRGRILQDGFRRQRLFTLLGFMGMYTVLAILFLFLVYREIEHGPDAEAAAGH